MVPVAGALFFVADLDHPVLDPEDAHHAQRVLRLRRGEELTVGDGRGSWRRVAFAPELVPVDDIVSEPAPDPALTVAFALVKGTKPEFVVQKLTEVGVDRIVPFEAERSVVRWDRDKRDRAVLKWRIVAREAAMQSRRAWLPEVQPVTTAREVLGPLGAVRADMGGRPIGVDDHVVAIGPEGGWSPSEVDLSPDAVVLGPHVLRAETAAVVAGALLAGRRIPAS